MLLWRHFVIATCHGNILSWGHFVIWFNPPFSKNVTTNVAKKFLSLLEKHFPKSNNLHKTFNGNSVKVSYCCNENLPSIIKSHNKKVINGKILTDPKSNCRKKSDCPLDSNCQKKELIYKCIITIKNYSGIKNMVMTLPFPNMYRKWKTNTTKCLP